jgi:hypothetical protein
MQVIEHLTSSAFSHLPALLFSGSSSHSCSLLPSDAHAGFPTFTVYKPRLVIITTPNHSFAPYFAPPSSSSFARNPRQSASALAACEDAHLHPDPTGRTSPTRLFRDPTHLFEFTSSEFHDWATSLAASTPGADDYELTFDGVGSLAQYWGSVSSGGYHDPQIPFPPPSKDVHPAMKDEATTTALPEDPRTFFATQIAVFRRRDPPSSAVSEEGEKADGGRNPRPSRPSPLPFYSRLTSPSSSHGAPRWTSSIEPATLPPQTLHSSFTLPSHPPLSAPSSHADILNSLERIFIEARRGPLLSLANIWRLGVGSSSFSSSPSAPSPQSPKPLTAPPLRELVAGGLTPILDALLSEEAGDEWELENLAAADEAAGEEGGARRVRRGKESLGIRWLAYEEVEVEAVRSWGIEEEVDEGKEEEVREEGEEGDGEAQYLAFPPSIDYAASGWGESSATGEWGRLSQSQSEKGKEGKGERERDEVRGEAEAGEHAREPAEVEAKSGWGDDEW